MSPEARYPWSALGLAKMPADATEIRRAYARALKQIDQATDMAGFTALRSAYEAALAIRAGRDVQNHGRKKAEPSVTEDATPAPPDPQTQSHDTKAEQIRLLEAFLLDDQSNTPAGQRILIALENPLSHEPDYAPSLRMLMAQLLRGQLRPDFKGSFSLSPQTTKETILALNQRYGWLSDYVAARQDFGQNSPLIGLMLERAYGDFHALAKSKQKPSAAHFGSFAVIVVGWFLLHGVRWLLHRAKGTPYEDTLPTVFILSANLGGMLWIYFTQKQRFSRKTAAGIACWYGLFFPLMLFAPPTNAGLTGRPLAFLWVSLTGSFWLFRFCSPIILAKGRRYFGHHLAIPIVQANAVAALFAPPILMQWLADRTISPVLIVFLGLIAIIICAGMIIWLFHKIDTMLRRRFPDRWNKD